MYLFLIVTGTPTNIHIVRTGDYTVQLSWSAPTSNTPLIAGYEVFYTESGSDATKSGGTTNSASTTISVNLPKLGVTYDLFVVAFSNVDSTLPSSRSSNVSVAIRKCNYL